MTSPEGVAQTAAALPKWAIAAIIVAGGFLAWKISKGVSDDPDRDAAKSHAEKQYDAYKKGTKVAPWNERARNAAISRGYSQLEVSSALRHYLGGGTMTPQDTTVISTIIGQIGTPQYPNSDPSYSGSSPQTNPGPGAPNAGLIRDPDSEAPSYNGGIGNAINFDTDPDAVSYWYVPSLGFGNTASYRGLAMLYYGDESKANVIMQVNRATPLAPSTVWQMIPPGFITKVPRSVSV